VIYDWMDLLDCNFMKILRAAKKFKRNKSKACVSIVLTQIGVCAVESGQLEWRRSEVLQRGS